MVQRALTGAAGFFTTRSNTMALITFSSRLHKDKTVHAVAGSHTQTILTWPKKTTSPSTLAAAMANAAPVWSRCRRWTQSVADGGPLTNRVAAAAGDMGIVTQPNSTKCTWTTFRRPNGAWLARWWCATRDIRSNTPASDVVIGGRRPATTAVRVCRLAPLGVGRPSIRRPHDPPTVCITAPCCASLYKATHMAWRLMTMHRPALASLAGRPARGLGCPTGLGWAQTMILLP